MKLLDILQKLTEFPGGMLYAVQDYDGEVKFGKHSQPKLFWERGVWYRYEDGDYPRIPGLDLAEDWDSAIVTKDMWERVKVKSKTINSLQPKHKHAEMISLCAEFAQTMENPMVMFQFKDCGVWVDFDLDSNLAFYNHREYRLKPKIKIINGVEIPDLQFKPFVGCDFYCANIGLPEFYETGHMGSGDCTFTKRMVERGLIYPYTEEGQQTAILHSKAMLGIA